MDFLMKEAMLRSWPTIFFLALLMVVSVDFFLQILGLCHFHCDNY